MLKHHSLSCAWYEVWIILILAKYLRSIQQQSEPETTLDFGVIKTVLIDKTGTFLYKTHIVRDCCPYEEH